jgi:hypothetical protein
MMNQDLFVTILKDLVNTLSPNSETAMADWRSVLLKQIADQTAKINKSIDQSKARFSSVYADVEEASKILANRGWYFDLQVHEGIFKRIVDLDDQDRESAIDSFFVNHFSQQIDSIQEELCSTFPLRAKVLTEAFAAHRSAQYSLSIPVFLAQADGICAEMFGDKLFQKQNGKPKVAHQLDKLKATALVELTTSALVEPNVVELEKLEIDKMGMFLSVLGRPGGICANEDFRSLYPNCLNRHEILHGIDTNYGTEMNGYKAISLIGFVGIFARTLTKRYIK